MSGCSCEIEVDNRSQVRVLIILLVINSIMFCLEIGVGWYAESTGLIADSMDMLADAIVYGIGLYAVGRTAGHKAHAALISGWFQAGLALLIVSDILRRILIGSEPISASMICIGVIALIANIICLALIQSHKDGEVHMRASWIFSKNDVIANTGVILSGGLVWALDNRWPDLLIGGLIALVILNGARHIILDALQELKNYRSQHTNSCNNADTTSSCTGGL